MDKDYLKNTKNNLILALVLTVAMVLISVIFGSPKQAKIPKIINNKPLISAEENIIKGTFETRLIKKQDRYVSFDVKYPYFFYASPGFNSKIKDFLETQVEAHSITSKEAWKARFETQTADYQISEFPKNEEEKFYFFSDFEIIQSNSSYVSVVVHYGGFSGGAHGYENRVSFAYDLVNKKEIKLSDLFMGDSEYLTNISDHARNYFKTSLEEKVKEIFNEEDDTTTVQEYVSNAMLMIENGTKPIVDNFSVFSFTKDKITIYFGQYQVGPYSDGMQQVEIPR